MIDETEINRGLVLHLDPDVLVGFGATYSCDDTRRVTSGHFFLCLRVVGETGEWLPLYTKPGPGRIGILEDGRSGHPKWTDGDCYYHPEQVWAASHAAVVNAAQAGHDKSEPEHRNSLAEGHIPEL